MSEIIKVAFVGTSCSGKTTSLETCQTRLNDNAIFVPEAAREYFINHPDIEERFSVVTQTEIQSLILEKEKQAHKQATSRSISLIICDRSVIDAPAYVFSQGNISGAEKLLDRVATWLPTYSKIFLLDPEDVPYVTDDVRQENQDARQIVHEAFLTFFANNNLPYESLSGTVEERFQQIQAYASLLDSQDQSIRSG